MIRLSPRRALVAAVVTFLVPAAAAASALAAKPVRASVAIVSPADGSTGSGAELTVSGTARGATAVAVTVAGDANTYEAAVVRGAWATSVNALPAGPTRICADALASGIVVATTCTTFTVEVDPRYFSLVAPEQGATVESTFTAVVGCHDGSVVRLTFDGVAELVDCVEYQVNRTYEAVAEGSHTLVAEQLALDGSTLVTVTRTFTSEAVPNSTVEVLDPADGSTDDARSVTVSGTQTSNVNDYVGIRVDGAFASATTAVDGAWSDVLTLDWGTHEICAFTIDRLGRELVSDCVTHTVALADDSLTITAPLAGSVQPGLVDVGGTCLEDFVVTLEAGGETKTYRCFEGGWRSDFFLGDGPHTLSVTMLADGAGTVTRSVSFTVDGTPPQAPTVTSPAPGGTLTTVPTQLTGRAETGSSVTVYDTTGTPYRTVTTDAAGTWTATLERDWFQTAGVLTGRRASVTFSIFSADPAGNQAEALTVTYQTRVR